jgi:uncharacterized protein
MGEIQRSGSGVQRSESSRSRSRKPKKSQIPYAVGIFAVIAAVGIIASTVSQLLAILWLTGAVFGFVLQRSRFCFTASMRDPALTGSTTITRAVLVAFAVTTLGFWAIKYGAFLRGAPIPGQGYVVPVSFATVIGAFMFGIGMVIAGGCASGTLMRVGEGFIMQMLSLLFFIIGSLWGAHDFGWWKLNVISEGKTVFLPDVFGWGWALVLQLLLIAVLFILADKWENRKKS